MSAHMQGFRPPSDYNRVAAELFASPHTFCDGVAHGHADRVTGPMHPSARSQMAQHLSTQPVSSACWVGAHEACTAAEFCTCSCGHSHAKALRVLANARSILDDPCKCSGNPPTYEYRGDKRQHCMWCDGLAA